MYSLLPCADAISLHVPLNRQTHHLLGEHEFDAMKSAAVVVNAARGGVLDEMALVRALQYGKLGGAALDVFETEPLTREAASVFAGVDKLILTPHIAGVSQESNVRVSEVTVRQVVESLAGPTVAATT